MCKLIGDTAFLADTRQYALTSEIFAETASGVKIVMKGIGTFASHLDVLQAGFNKLVSANFWKVHMPFFSAISVESGQSVAEAAIIGG